MDTDIQGLANFSVLGMPGTSNRFTVNGMNENDNGASLPLVGSLNLLLGQNQIQEATVVSIGYSGQFGGTAGANVNYITKSGGNDFYGNAQYYWNGRVFNANDWFNNAYQQPRPFDIANQWAGSFGGPIKKNKLFFFFDTEGLRVTIPSVTQVLIPSPQFEEATIANIDSRFGAASPSHAFYEKIFNLYNGAPGAGSAIPGDFVAGNLGCAGLRISLGDGVPCVMHYLASLSVPSQDALTSGRFDWNPDSSDHIFFRVLRDAGHTTVLAPPNYTGFRQESTQTWWQGKLSRRTIPVLRPQANSSSPGHILIGRLVQRTRESDAAALPSNHLFPPPEQFTGVGDSSQFRVVGSSNNSPKIS
jgi:hypothetical protein